MKFALTLCLLTGLAAAEDAASLIPLNELASGEYMGFKGGLYAAGSNTPPAAHAEALKARCAQIQPLDKDGRPSATGSIVIAGIGASVCRQIFGQLEETGIQWPGINPKVKFVNCAVGGADINKIADDRYWSKVNEALAAEGLSAAQVQVVWYQSDDLRDSRDDFPGRPQRLQAALAGQMQLIGAHFPNARLCYHSARHTTAFMPKDGKAAAKHGEPRPYHVGWAVKWLIESPANGQEGAPLAAWSGYFWTNGEKPRADGYRWTSAMNVQDGVHLSEAGIKRVANELCDFWIRDAFAQTWFAAHPAPPAASKPKAEVPVKPQIAAAQALKPGEPALLINGKSKFAKLERLLNTSDPVRLVAYDLKENKVLLTVDDVFRQRLDLNEKLGSGEFRLHFLGRDGKRLPMSMEVPDVVKIK